MIPAEKHLGSAHSEGITSGIQAEGWSQAEEGNWWRLTALHIGSKNAGVQGFVLHKHRQA